MTDDPRARIAEIRRRLHAGALGGLGSDLRWLADEAERLADERDRVTGELAELTEAKYHGAYVDCGHGIQTVNMAAFGRKISEKRQALAERDACLAETNRARDAEQAALHRVAELENVITWDTTCAGCARLLDSCYGETVRAERAETALRLVQAVTAPRRDLSSPQEYFDAWEDALAAVRDAAVVEADDDAGEEPPRLQTAEATLWTARHTADYWHRAMRAAPGQQAAAHACAMILAALAGTTDPAELGLDPMELTREELEEQLDDGGRELYKAQDLLAFIREMCDSVDRDGSEVTTERVRTWLGYTGCGGVLTLPPEAVAALATMSGDAPDKAVSSGDAGGQP